MTTLQKSEDPLRSESFRGFIFRVAIEVIVVNPALLV
jgi:hypothetical protein